MNTEKKSFAVALVFWLFLGSVGAHKVYIKESVWPLFYYWLLTICTLGIILLVDLFRLKSMIETQHMVEYTKREMIKNS